MSLDTLALLASTATLGIAFFSGVSEAQLFLESRYVHLAGFHRAAVERFRAEAKTDLARAVPMGRFLVPYPDPDNGGWRRKQLEFALNGNGGAAPSLFHVRLTRKAPFLGYREGLYFFEEWPRSLYGDFYWPRTVPLWSAHRAVRRWARQATQAQGDAGRDDRLAGRAGEHASRMLWHMWVWRRLMTLKWIGIALTLTSSLGAVLWAVGVR